MDVRWNSVCGYTEDSPKGPVTQGDLSRGPPGELKRKLSDTTTHVPSTPKKRDSIKSSVLKCAGLLHQWITEMGNRHVNCKSIDAKLIIRITLEIIRVTVKSGRCERKNDHCKKFATALWIALKFYSSRNTIPNASFMSIVTGVSKQSLLQCEVLLLQRLDWDVYSIGHNISWSATMNVHL